MMPRPRSLALLLALACGAAHAAGAQGSPADPPSTWGGLVGERVRVWGPEWESAGRLAAVEGDTLLLYGDWLGSARVPAREVGTLHLSMPTRSRRWEGTAAGLLLGAGAGHLWYRGGCFGLAETEGARCSGYSAVAPITFGLVAAVVGNWFGGYFVVDRWVQIPVPPAPRGR